MKMLVGLGNPGERYDGTRHNVGFMVLDQVIKQAGIQFDQQKFNADFTIWRCGTEKIICVKPFTYMNNSGEAVLPLMSYFGVGLEDLLVVYDDLDLEPGRIRLRSKGSAGGHNGIKSLIHLLGSQEFDRIKVGIGRPLPGWKVVDHVLAVFDPESASLVQGAIDKSVKIIEEWANGSSFIDLMNRYNA